MIRFIAFVISISTFFGQPAFGSEITSKNGNDSNYIQVLVNDQGGEVQLGFRFCTAEPQEASDCDAVIGAKDFYAVKDLIKERHKQEWDVLGASLLDTVVAAGSIVTGTVAGAAIGAAVGASSSVEFSGLAGLAEGGVIGGAVGAAGGGVLVKMVHALNPFYHGRQAGLISKALISGQDIQVMSVEDYAKELASDLNGIH